MTNSLLPSVFGNRSKTPHTFQSLQREIDRVFHEFRDVFPGFSERDDIDADGNIVPKLDISESDNEVEITVELPGVEEKDLDITVSGNTLTLKGEKSSKRETEEKDYKLVERSYGSFARALPFAFDIDPENISAKFVDGVLQIAIKKPPDAQQKAQKVEISKAA